MAIEYEPETSHVSRIVITCDTCGEETDSLKLAEQSTTLTELGWRRTFNPATRQNEYFCPAHKAAVCAG